MNDYFKQYQEDAHRTLSRQFNIGPDMPACNGLHGAIGVVTEIGEMIEALYDGQKEGEVDHVNFKEEIGDCFWYVAILTTFCGLETDMYEGVLESPALYVELTIAQDTPTDEHLLDLVIYSNKVAAQLLDIFKKGIFYNKPVNDLEMKKGVVRLIGALSLMCDACRTNPQDVMKVNIDKLKARFPNKFNSDDANNRDLVKERDILEGASRVIALDICDVVYLDGGDTIEVTAEIEPGAPYHTFTGHKSLFSMTDANVYIKPAATRGVTEEPRGGKGNDTTC